MLAPTGIVTVPVNVGDAIGARVVSEGCTWSCLAYRSEVPIKTAPFIEGFELLACPTTNWQVANCVVEVSTDAVGAVGIPVNAGEFRGAPLASVAWTWSCLAYRREVPTAAVPLGSGATLPACPVTNPQVANCVDEVSTDAVGAAGIPVNVGDAIGARVVSLG